jgi:hypothetical protein
MKDIRANPRKNRADFVHRGWISVRTRNPGAEILLVFLVNIVRVTFFQIFLE